MARKTILETAYTFTPSTGTIVAPLIIQRERLVLITNVTTNTVIYNFSDSNLKASSFTKDEIGYSLMNILEDIYISKQKNKINEILNHVDKKSKEEVVSLLKNIIISHRDKYIYINNIKKINNVAKTIVKPKLSKSVVDLSHVKKAGSKYFLDAFSRDATSRLQQTVIQTINKSFDYKNPIQRKYGEQFIHDIKNRVITEKLFDTEVYNLIHHELNANYLWRVIVFII